MRRLLLALPLLALAACATAQPQVGASQPQVGASQPTPPAAPAPVATAPSTDGPKNVILFIADGFGPASATLGAAAKGAPLAFEPYLVGAVETSATDSRVTDSASSATAYACGLKTYNGAIGMTPDRQPCVTVLERAEAAGFATGLVATSRITHATPAAFAAHVPSRSQEAEIAAQLATAGVDVLFGGGRSYFADTLAAQMRAGGVAVALDRAGYDALAAAPAAAFLADSHLAFEVDRDATDQPSLADLTTKALDLLTATEAARETGFFLMVEASRIDHAGHANDPVGHLGDILAYDRAVEAALAYAGADGETLVVLTADHETGGMTLGRDGIYQWDPAPLLRATASYEAMSAAVAAGADPVETVRVGLGLDALPEGAAEAIRGAVASGSRYALDAVARDLISEPAGIGWTTGGHTAVDVGLYAVGPGADRFAGRMPNDAVGRALFAALGLDLGAAAE